MEEFPKLDKFSVTEIEVPPSPSSLPPPRHPFQNAFGRIQYFESPEEELPHYCDVAYIPPIVEEEDELPDYSEIVPSQQLPKTITVKVCPLPPPPPSPHPSPR
jgi:hypothetical protein